MVPVDASKRDGEGEKERARERGRAMRMMASPSRDDMNDTPTIPAACASAKAQAAAVEQTNHKDDQVMAAEEMKEMKKRRRTGEDGDGDAHVGSGAPAAAAAAAAVHNANYNSNGNEVRIFAGTVAGVSDASEKVDTYVEGDAVDCFISRGSPCLRSLDRQRADGENAAAEEKEGNDGDDDDEIFGLVWSTKGTARVLHSDAPNTLHNTCSMTARVGNSRLSLSSRARETKNKLKNDVYWMTPRQLRSIIVPHWLISANLPPCHQSIAHHIVKAPNGCAWSAGLSGSSSVPFHSSGVHTYFNHLPSSSTSI